MSFYFGLFVWLILAAILTLGVVMAAKGSMILLAVGAFAFVLAFIKFGCLTH